jgi:tRNA(fMet)-specific endonuclease VapC
MKRILLDTNVYIAFKRDDPHAVALIQEADFIGINSVVAGELLAGFICGTKNRENRKQLDQFLDSPRVSMLVVDDNTAEFYASAWKKLRDKGRPIPTNDIWVAASAMQHGLALATLDGHFEAIEGLLLEGIEGSAP